MTESFWYPSVEDVLTIHQDIVSAYPETSSGVQNPGDIEFALAFSSGETSGREPTSIHGKAFHLLRLLVANHPFVDSNKRTALNTVVVFYLFNGYRFEFDERIRDILRQFGTESGVDTEDDIRAYLQSHTTRVDVESELSQYREDLVRYGLDELVDETSDPND